MAVENFFVRKRFFKLTLRTKWFMPSERALKSAPKNGVRSCMHFCLKSLEPLERCVYIKPTEKTLGQWPDLIATGSRRSKHVLAARPPASSLTPTATPPSKGSPISGTTPEAKGDSNNAESLSLTLPDTPEDSILQSEQGSSGMAAFAFS